MVIFTNPFEVLTLPGHTAYTDKVVQSKIKMGYRSIFKNAKMVLYIVSFNVQFIHINVC